MSDVSDSIQMTEAYGHVWTDRDQMIVVVRENIGQAIYRGQEVKILSARKAAGIRAGEVGTVLVIMPPDSISDRPLLVQFSGRRSAFFGIAEVRPLRVKTLRVPIQRRKFISDDVDVVARLKPDRRQSTAR